MKQHDNDTYEKIWVFEPQVDGEPIILSEFYSDDCFVLVDWDANVRAYSISKREEIIFKDYGGKISCRAAMNNDKTKLYVVVSPDNGDSFVRVLTLPDFTEVYNFNMVEPFDRVSTRYFEYLNNKITFYHHYRYEKEYKHGYITISEADGNAEVYPLEFPHWHRFGEKCGEPVYNEKENVGVLPYWGPLVTEKDEGGNPFFLYQVMVYNLTNFNVERVIPIHKFSVSQLGRYEKDNKEKAEVLLTGDVESREYKKAYEDLMDLLSGIYINEENGSFWISYTGGIFRRFDKEGNVSPAFIIKDVNDSEIQEEYLCTFHGKVFDVRGNEVYIKDHDDCYKIEIPDFENGDNLSSVVPVSYKTYERKIISSKELDDSLEDMRKVVVSVPNINEEKSLMQALDKMNELIKDIDSIRSGQILNFQIVDDLGNKLEEKDFFGKVIELKKAPKKIDKLIKSFIDYDETNEFYIDDETCALGYAVNELLGYDSKFIDTAIKFIEIIDAEHDVFCYEEIITTLYKKYNDKYGKAILKKLAKTREGELWVEAYESNME